MKSDRNEPQGTPTRLLSRTQVNEAETLAFCTSPHSNYVCQCLASFVTTSRVELPFSLCYGYKNPVIQSVINGESRNYVTLL